MCDSDCDISDYPVNILIGIHAINSKIILLSQILLQQHGVNRCGLFAMAFIYQYCSSNKIGAVTLKFSFFILFKRILTFRST